MGVGTAALLVASFSGAQKSALESISVTPDQIYAVIAGIWHSSFALGNFIGPTLGGFLVDYIGFRNTTTVFQVCVLKKCTCTILSINKICIFQVGSMALLCLDLINLFCLKNKTTSNDLYDSIP